MIRVVVGGYLASGASSAAEQLDLPPERERAVLVLIADGMSDTDIGVHSHLSVGTAKDHVSAISTRLRVAQRAGLLEDGEQ